MLALGVDPGTRDLALVLLDVGPRRAAFVHGWRVHLEGSDVDGRSAAIFRLATRLLEQHRPDVVACEMTFLGGRSRTVHHVSRVVGILHAAAIVQGCTFLTLTPTDVKAAVAGHGHSPKTQVAEAVRLQVSGLPDHLIGARGRRVQLTDHVADAAAVALAAAARAKLVARVGEVPGRVAVFSPPAEAAGG